MTRGRLVRTLVPISGALTLVAALAFAQDIDKTDPTKQGAPSLGTGRPVTVLVTAAIGDAGIKDAQVDVLDYDLLKKEWGEMHITPLFSDWEEMYQRKGLHFTTDFGGTTIIPRPANRCFIAVRIPGQFGFSEMYASEPSPFLMKLEVDQVLHVQVVDKQGQPVQGICVGANMPNVRQIKDRLDEDKVIWLASGFTGADGVAHLEHMQWWKDPHFKELRDNPMPYQAEVGPYFVERYFTTFDPEKDQQPRVKLTIPDTGRVVVPLPPGVKSYARLRAHLPKTDFDKRSWPLKVPYRNESTEGQAVFPRVGLGIEFDYEVWWSGLAAPRRGSAKGPTKPGEEVVFPRLDSFAEDAKKPAPTPKR